MADTPEYRGWLYSVLIAIDQLGNALAGVLCRFNHFCTGGLQCAAFSFCEEKLLAFIRMGYRLYLLALDGPNHCYQAYLAGNKTHYRDGSDAMRVVLSTLILFWAMPIALATRILAQRKHANKP